METYDVVVLPREHQTLQELQRRRTQRIAEERRNTRAAVAAAASDNTCSNGHETVVVKPRASLMGTDTEGCTGEGCSESSSISDHSSSSSIDRNKRAIPSSMKRSLSMSDSSLLSSSTHVAKRRQRPATSKPNRTTTPPNRREALVADTGGYESGDGEPVFRVVSGPSMSIRAVPWA